MRKVILTKKVSENLVKRLSELAEVVVVPEGNKGMFESELATADAVLLSTSFKINAELLKKCTKLKVISRTGVGYDNVDVEEATNLNILVLNTPNANSISVAEHTLTFILALAKQIVFYDNQTRTGNFAVRRTNKAVDIDGKVLGLLGCGKIGLMVAQKCRSALNMQIIGFDPYLTTAPEGIVLVPTIEELFEKADFLSIHIPKNEKTSNLINKRLLEIMKPTSFIINTSRGGLIVENDLIDVLNQGKIAGAALDVFEVEPMLEGNPLAQKDNVILTPHSAALTNECNQRVAIEAIEGIIHVLNGHQPENSVNKVKLKMNQ